VYLFTAYSLAVGIDAGGHIVAALRIVVVVVAGNTCHQPCQVGPEPEQSVPHGMCTPSPVVPSRMVCSSKRKGNQCILKLKISKSSFIFSKSPWVL
jgi:hypothetical protein